MKVRDHTQPKNEYQGRPTEASDRLCPCRPCFRGHDYGRSDFQGKWKTNMRCFSREQGGCPDTKPEPEHVFTKFGKVCKRCHARRTDCKGETQSK